MKKHFVLLAALGLAVLAFAVPAQGALLNLAITGGLNTINDKDVERIVGDGDNEIEVGESLEAILVLDNISNSLYAQEDLDNIFGPNYSLTAYSKITVLAIIPNGGAGDLNPVDGLSTFVFGNGINATTAVRVYEDSGVGTTHPAFGTSAATGIAATTDGTLILELGMTEPGDYWLASGPTIITSLPASGGSAQFFFGLTVQSNPGGLPIEDEGVTSALLPFAGFNYDVVGFGDVFKPTTGVNADWQASSNTTVQFQVVAPEPGSMLIWAGMGLIGTCVAARRRRKVTV